MASHSPDSETRFREWVARFRPLLAKVVRGFANSWQDEQELFQDVLVQLWRSAARFDGRCAESTWVYRVAFNTAMGWSRTAKRRQSKQTDTIDLDSMPTPAAPDTARIDALYAAIRQLDAPDAALIMMHLEGASYREMAEVMGLSEANIGTRLTRTRSRLATLLTDYRHE